MAATFHCGIGGQAGSSISSYVYNHVATLSMGHAHLAKSLFLGGVTRRFPELRFGFLEGGVGWGVSLLADLHGHWEKRGWKHIESLDPAKLDTEHFLGLVEEYGDAKAKAKLGEIAELFARPLPHPEQLDDFAQAGVKRREDFKDRFVESFYFGCEADDPVNALAFDRKLSPVGETLQICYGTDIGHWDVPVCNDVLHEAWELVDHGLLNEAQFRQFVYSNAVRLHAHTNRDFFKGTRVEREAAKMLKAGK